MDNVTYAIIRRLHPGPWSVRQLFTQKETLSGQGGTKAQAGSEEAHGINHERELHGRESYVVAKLICTFPHHHRLGNKHPGDDPTNDHSQQADHNHHPPLGWR
jgi:hypothetical protein